ncbi:hypothetical protein GGR57DRAFT_73888 [Xylariaceae sp. FL1272]|nr:hypothetical protein GGR57DRAFT_73888 [Xylariaceae sp. FL1272]
MRFETLFAALAALAAASPAVGRALTLNAEFVAAATLDYNWHVTEWKAGCSTGECVYEFDIAGAANATSKPPRPEFKASCSGRGEGAEYAPCEKLINGTVPYVVVAKLQENNNSTANGTRFATIQVSYIYETDQAIRYNYTGQATSVYNELSSTRSHFAITPDQLSAVAK